MQAGFAQVDAGASREKATESRWTGMDERGTDRELVAAFDELIEAAHEARQAAWIAPRGPRRDALDALFEFLRVEAATLADAEAAIFGRSPDMVSPSEQTSRNLIADAHDIPDAVVPLLIERVEGVAGQLRTRAERIEDSSLAKVLRDIADGLQTHTELLASADRAGG
jgi:hypothetical protein